MSSVFFFFKPSIFLADTSSSYVIYSSQKKGKKLTKQSGFGNFSSLSGYFKVRPSVQSSNKFSGALAKRAQRSTMGKKIVREILVLTRNRPYGVRPDVRPPLHVSRREILHFKHTRVSAVNRIATRTFRDKKNNNNKADSFFGLNFKVYIGVDNRERARGRDKKQRRPISFEE